MPASSIFTDTPRAVRPIVGVKAPGGRGFDLSQGGNSLQLLSARLESALGALHSIDIRRAPVSEG